MQPDAAEEFRQHNLRRKRERREQACAELARKQAEWVGDFDTGLTCHCGKPIIDHATERDLRHRRIPSIAGCGPAENDEDRNRCFSVCHRYSCGSCGLSYDTGIIENVRGYVSRDEKYRRAAAGQVKETLARMRQR